MGSSICLNQIITINRGDTFSFSLSRELIGNDAVYFGVTWPHYKFEDAIIKKSYTQNDLDENNNLLIKIEPEDTLNLVPGKYYYSIKLKEDHSGSSGENIKKITTLVGPSKFIICN